MNLNKEEEHILLHSLGWSNLRWYEEEKIGKKPYRNYFYTSKDTVDYPYIKILIEKGLMIDSKRGWEKGSCYFFVTEKGIDLAYSLAKNNIEKNKPSRSKRRYQAYLHSETTESFIEWLTNPYWSEYRKSYNC